MAYGFALITGAISGIGEAFARELPRKSGLLLTGRDHVRVATLAEELADQGRPVETLAGELHGVPVDVPALCPGPTRTSFFDRSGLPSLKPASLAGPRQVVREGLAVVGGTNRLAAAAARLAPRPLLRAGARTTMRRWGTRRRAGEG